jgi:hypothetical protein
MQSRVEVDRMGLGSANQQLEFEDAFPSGTQQQILHAPDELIGRFDRLRARCGPSVRRPRPQIPTGRERQQTPVGHDAREGHDVCTSNVSLHDDRRCDDLDRAVDIALLPCDYAAL